MQKMSLIMASTWNSVVGDRGSMPWKSSRDMQRFKELTTGNIVVMGRGTWDSLGRKPLKDRLNIVVSKQMYFDKKDDNFIVCPDLQNVLHILEYNLEISKCAVDKEIFLIGGAKLAKSAMQLELIDKLYMTTVCGYVHGDTYFHPFNFPQKWKPTYASAVGKNENDTHSTIFFNYELKGNDEDYAD